MGADGEIVLVICKLYTASLNMNSFLTLFSGVDKFNRSV